MIAYFLIALSAVLWFWPEIAAILPEPTFAPKPETAKKPTRKRKDKPTHERTK